MKLRRIVVRTSGALRQSRISDAIEAHAAPASIAASSEGTRPKRDASSAASAPTMNCPSPPMFHTPARNAMTTLSPVRSSGTDLRSVPCSAKVLPTEPVMRMVRSSRGE